MRLSRASRRRWRLCLATAATTVVVLGLPVPAAPAQAQIRHTGGTPAGCTQTNGTDVPIPDNTTVESPIVISGCAGTASATSTVAVHIVHPFPSDLRVTLFAPDGTPYLLYNRLGGPTANLNQAFQVDLSSETSDGTWRLWVGDWASSDTGYLDTWTLRLDATPPPGCTGTNGTDVPIPFFTIVDSTVTIADCPGTGNPMSTVAVRIVHPFIGDLVVHLVAPDGTEYLLHNRTGGGLDRLNRTYSLDLSGEARDGTWALRVQDVSSGDDTGYIDTWTLTL